MIEKLMRSYNKSDIVSYLTLLHPEHTPAYFRDIVNEVFDCVMKFAKAGEKMNVTNFGSFRSYVTPERLTRNPLTGERVMSKPKRKVQFRPSKLFSKIHE